VEIGGSNDRVALRRRLRVDLPTEVARTTVVPALPDFMAVYPELELEMSSTDRQVDLVQEGFDCVLRLGPIGDETLIARPLGKLRMVNVASPAYLARHGIPRSLEDLQRQGHRTDHFSTMLGARPHGWEYPDGDGYATTRDRSRDPRSAKRQWQEARDRPAFTRTTPASRP